MNRSVLVVTNPHRPEIVEATAAVERALAEAGIQVVHDPAQAGSAEAAIVLGGDGTMLHAAHLTYGMNIPLLGVNLGRVGFLAELDRDDAAAAVRHLATGEYATEERGTLEVKVTRADGSVESGWALNEVTVERAERVRTLEVSLAVDDRPLSSFGCDGIVVSTATGSTAHAFSAGGPVMWPDVDALLFVPLAAHALFARPLVVGPDSRFRVEVVPSSDAAAQVVLDGARAIDAGRGCVIEVAKGEQTVTLARLSDAPFTQRLVDKFSLPTDGWRGERARQTPIGREIESQETRSAWTPSESSRDES